MEYYGLRMNKCLILDWRNQLKISIKFVKTIKQMLTSMGLTDATLEGIG